MLVSDLETSHPPLGQAAEEAIEHFPRRQQPDGSIAEDPTSAMFREWDSVNVLKAIAWWQNEIPADATDVIERTLGFLAAQEKPTGMLSYGGAEVAAGLHTALALATLAHAGMSADGARPSETRRLLARRRFSVPGTDGYRDFYAPQDAFTTAQVLIAFKPVGDNVRKYADDEPELGRYP